MDRKTNRYLIKLNEHTFLILSLVCFISIFYTAYKLGENKFYLLNPVAYINSQSNSSDKRNYLSSNGEQYAKIPHQPSFNKSQIGIIRVGILIASSTRKIKNPKFEKLSLITLCLPSIYKTLQASFNYSIYIGIDPGDFLFSIKDKLKLYHDNINVIITPGKTFAKVINAVARKAYEDGNDYLVRINDDTTFETSGWTSQGIHALRQYKPPNIGVVGPTCKQGNTMILTHDMVHRSHLDIFDFYYPPYFDNWWIDDWITRVYKPDRSTKLPEWIVKHHLKYHNTMYKVNFKQEPRLNKILAYDQERLTDYLIAMGNK